MPGSCESIRSHRYGAPSNECQTAHLCRCRRHLNAETRTLRTTKASPSLIFQHSSKRRVLPLIWKASQLKGSLTMNCSQSLTLSKSAPVPFRLSLTPPLHLQISHAPAATSIICATKDGLRKLITGADRRAPLGAARIFLARLTTSDLVVIVRQQRQRSPLRSARSP